MWKAGSTEAQRANRDDLFHHENAGRALKGFLPEPLIENFGCSQFCDGQSTSVPQGSTNTESKQLHVAI
jgi:hypothetical protein